MNIFKNYKLTVGVYLLFSYHCFAAPPLEIVHQISEKKDREIGKLASLTLLKAWGNFGPADGTNMQIDSIKLEKPIDGFNHKKNCYLVTLNNWNGELRAMFLISEDAKTAKIIYFSDFNDERTASKVPLETLKELEAEERLRKIEMIEEIEEIKDELNVVKLEGLKKLKLQTLDELIEKKKLLLKPGEVEIKK